MADLNVPDELVAHLAQMLGVPSAQARRAAAEVLDYYREPLEAFVTRRHRELQGSGLTNAAVFEQVLSELASQRFPAPNLTQRQIRRLIYG